LSVTTAGTYLRDVRPELVVDPREPALFLTVWWGYRLSEVSLAVLVRHYGQLVGLPAATLTRCATPAPRTC
jgi:hypothetical protein